MQTPVIFLFMGGFMLGLAIEKCNLHRRTRLKHRSAHRHKWQQDYFGFFINFYRLNQYVAEQYRHHHDDVPNCPIGGEGY